jgi:hypothetical protein
MCSSFQRRSLARVRAIRTSARETNANVGSANNINKLSLVGVQPPEKYKENFDVWSEGPSSGVILAK